MGGASAVRWERLRGAWWIWLSCGGGRCLLLQRGHLLHPLHEQQEAFLRGAARLPLQVVQGAELACQGEVRTALAPRSAPSRRASR